MVLDFAHRQVVVKQIRVDVLPFFKQRLRVNTQRLANLLRRQHRFFRVAVGFMVRPKQGLLDQRLELGLGFTTDDLH
ncbi:hypothetical protein D3C71_1703890 [compost metagenome]